MRINESTFRKILREEARRTLNEVEGTPPAAAAIPTGGAGAVSGPATAAASGALAGATARYATAYNAAREQGFQLVTINTDLGMRVSAGIGNLKDPASPAVATLQSALKAATDRGTARGVAGRNLMLFATLATGKPVGDWKVAVKSLGYQAQIGVEAAKLDDPSKIINPDAALKSLIGLATKMGDGFSAAVTALPGASQEVKTAAGAMAPKAGAAFAPAPGTAPATAPAAAAGPAKGWPGYNAKVREGAAINRAWNKWVGTVSNAAGLYDATFGSFVSYYNTMVRQKSVKFLSPAQILKMLTDDITNASAPAQTLTPVVPAPTPPVTSFTSERRGRGRLIR